MTKIDKMRVLGEVPETYDRLRICYAKPHGLVNCCNCRKCVNSMTALELSGILNRYTTFPLPLDRHRLRFAELSYTARGLFWEYYREAIRQRRYDLVVDMTIRLGVNYFGWGAKWVQQGFRR